MISEDYHCVRYVSLLSLFHVHAIELRITTVSVCHSCSACPCLRESLYMSGLVSVSPSHLPCHPLLHCHCNSCTTHPIVCMAHHCSLNTTTMDGLHGLCHIDTISLISTPSPQIHESNAYSIFPACCTWSTIPKAGPGLAHDLHHCRILHTSNFPTHGHIVACHLHDMPCTHHHSAKAMEIHTSWQHLLPCARITHHL